MKDFIEVTQITKSPLRKPRKKIILNIDQIANIEPIGDDIIGCEVYIGNRVIKTAETYNEFISILNLDNNDDEGVFYCSECGNKITGDFAQSKASDGRERIVCMDCFNYYAHGNYTIKYDE